jgi:hypothetical protein
LSSLVEEDAMVRSGAWVIAAAAVMLANPPGAASNAAADEGWDAAEKALAAHLDPIIETARQRHGDPEIRSAEYRSARMSRFLPDHRVFVKTGPYDGTSSIFVLERSGKVHDLGEGIWKGGEDGVVRAGEVAEFVKGRKIAVRSPEEAVEAARFFEELQGSSNYVKFLQINTKGFRVFDSRFISKFYGDRSEWKYTGEKRDGGWKVTVEYVGPPAMIQQPPVYAIDVDGDARITDIHRTGLIPPK